MKLWKRFHGMLAAGKLSHQKYIIVFQDCVLKVCEPFHYVSSVKVSKPTAFLLHYSDKASFPLRCFNDLTWASQTKCNPSNLSKQSQLLDYLSSTYMFARSGLWERWTKGVDGPFVSFTVQLDILSFHSLIWRLFSRSQNLVENKSHSSMIAPCHTVTMMSENRTTSLQEVSFAFVKNYL